MDSTTLSDLKRIYEQKRRKAIQDAEIRKKEIYHKLPRLSEIDAELSKASLSSAMQILKSSQSSLTISNLKKITDTLQKEKIELLKKEGKTLEDLSPIFSCSKCKDIGYIEKNGKTEMCTCLKQEIFNIEYNKSNMGNLEKENFSTFRLNVYSDEINPQKYKSNISPRENMQRIEKIAKNFISHFDDPEQKNLIFMGNSGLGKTFLSNCIANEILKLGKTVLYQTAPVMLNDIINCLFDKPNCNKNIIENLLSANLLIIDDFGTESVNNMKFTEIFNILNTRLLNQNRKITKTIISTNLNLQNIYSIYDERIASRIVGYYEICKFFGDDIRFQKI